MTFKSLKPLTAAVLAASVAVGCVDDNYDLSDIDTTTRIDVTDLTVPVNIDPVTLGNIITIDDDDPDARIKPQVINGKNVYALTEHGSFESGRIKISDVKAKAPTLQPTERTLEQVLAGAGAPARLPEITDDYAVTYEIVNMGNSVDYTVENVDKAIQSIKSIGIEPLRFKVHLQALNVDGKVDQIVFTDLNIQMPKGLTIDAAASTGNYDAETGLWVIKRHEVASNNVTDAYLVATGINFETAGATIAADRTLAYKGDFKVLSGLLTIKPIWVNGLPAMLPTNLQFKVNYELTDLTATSFSGQVEYLLDGMDIAPISLSDIPDFLTKDGTELRLANPQIFLRINNPVADAGRQGLECSTGLTLTANRPGVPSFPFSPNKGAFTIGKNHGVAGPYCFVLAPENEGLATPEDYKQNLQFVQFTGLTDLLAVPQDVNCPQSVPKSIGITLNSPQVFSQPIDDFKLPADLDPVKGYYDLVAPLALTTNSFITYTDDVDGWSSEDLDAVTITSLTVTATVDNGCPAGAELTAWPLTVGGKVDKNVQITSNKLLPSKDGQKVEITMTGTVRLLDGVRFQAVLSGAGGEALSPDQVITLRDVRAKVSGYYQKKF